MSNRQRRELRNPDTVKASYKLSEPRRSCFWRRNYWHGQRKTSRTRESALRKRPAKPANPSKGKSKGKSKKGSSKGSTKKGKSKGKHYSKGKGQK